MARTKTNTQNNTYNTMTQQTFKVKTIFLCFSDFWTQNSIQLNKVGDLINALKYWYSEHDSSWPEKKLTKRVSLK